MKKEENRLVAHACNLDFGYLVPYKFVKMRLSKSAVVQGRGVVVRENIKKGQIICPLYGILYNIKKAKINYPKYSYQISDTIAIETTIETGYFNHSCEPNVYVNQDWLIEALKPIKPGEEILLDYGTVDYFPYTFKCTCESDTCRKIVDGTMSADSAYQKRMGRFFSPYLKEKFRIASI